MTFAARLESGTRPGAAWLLLLGAGAAVAGSFYVLSVSRIAPHPFPQGLLLALVCFGFVAPGAYALRLRPYARFGLLLAAVGFASLVSVLHEFSDRAINLTKIESRPSREELGVYIFLIDIEGHREDPLIEQALAAVREQADFFKVFGSYPAWQPE